MAARPPVIALVVCVCARLTHGLEGGVLVESHCAVVAVRVWESLSKGSVGGVIQVVLFWMETSTRVDGLRWLWLRNVAN